MVWERSLVCGIVVGGIYVWYLVTVEIFMELEEGKRRGCGMC